MQVIKGMIMILLVIFGTPVARAVSADPLFQDQSTLNVEISAPLGTLIRDRPEIEYLPGSFSFKDTDGKRVILDVQVRARGNFRHSNCDFPPLNLNFRRSQVEGTLLDQQNKLKMVVHCKDSLRYQQAVLREYLAYRLLNALTDLSFRVRLLQVTWVDSDERRGRMVRNAFLIEHENRLAARIGREELDIERARISAVEPGQLNLAAMFQYLIGNVDFSPLAGGVDECCHNYALFGNDTDSLVAIPYDFDLAGIVNAPYADPDKAQGVERVGQRVYRGYCVNNGHVTGSVAEFRKVRDELYALVEELNELEPGVRANVARYMDEFYAVIDDPRKVERDIIGQCN